MGLVVWGGRSQRHPGPGEWAITGGEGGTSLQAVARVKSPISSVQLEQLGRWSIMRDLRNEDL